MGVSLTLGEDRRSAPFDTLSKTTPTVPTSTQHSEIMAAHAGIKMAMGSHYKLVELKVDEYLNLQYTRPMQDARQNPDVVTLEEDNKAAHDFFNRTTARQQSQHYDPVLNYVPEQVEMGNVRSVLTPTDDMKADGLTKTLTPAEYQRKLKYLQGEPHSPLEGIDV